MPHNSSLAELIENGHRHARAVLIGENEEQLVPFFHIQFKDRPPAIMPTPFGDEREKAAFIAAVRAAMKHFRPSIESYSFLSEAWVARSDHPPPSQREDRRECVIVSAGDRNGAQMKMWEIVRDDQGRVTDLVEDRAKPGAFEGRFYNLMADDDAH